MADEQAGATAKTVVAAYLWRDKSVPSRPSIDEQRWLVERYARPLRWEIGTVYVDDASSARKDFARLGQDARPADSFRMVLCYGYPPMDAWDEATRRELAARDGGFVNVAIAGDKYIPWNAEDQVVRRLRWVAHDARESLAPHAPNRKVKSEDIKERLRAWLKGSTGEVEDDRFESREPGLVDAGLVREWYGMMRPERQETILDEAINPK